MNSVNEDPRVLAYRSELRRLEHCWYEYLHEGSFRFCSPSEVSMRIRLQQQLLHENGVLLERLQGERAWMSQLTQQNSVPHRFRRLIFPNERRYSTFLGHALRLDYEIEVITILRDVSIRMIDTFQHIMPILPGARSTEWNWEME